MTPPAQLTQKTPQPQLKGETIGVALELIPKLRGAVRQCNVDKAAMRSWIERTEQEYAGGDGE